MKVLFSPVGGTDPISLNNMHDGALLHICREMKPDKVIMYMSKEILRNHKSDNRYIYCLEKLSVLQKRTIRYEIIERPDLTNVQEFDYFYRDFRNIIEQVITGLSEHDSLLLNISSGTPAMKSGIAVLSTLEEYPCQLVQVTTPVRGMNDHSHNGYDVEALWELDEDNEKYHENRCRVIENLPTLSKIKKEEIIKRHVDSYDYVAALTVAKTLTVPDRENYYELLQIANSRLLLDMGTVRKQLKTADNKYLMDEIELARKLSANIDYQKCFEYALSLQVKLRKGEYADFIRAITPLLVELLKLVLVESCGIKIEQYCLKNGEWDRGKLVSTKIDHILQKAYNPFRYGYVYSDHLNIIINQFAENIRLKELSNDIRKVERNIRNLAAHEIVVITDSDIKHKTGFYGRQIMNLIKELFNYAGPELDPQAWNSYDRMNDLIKRKI